MQVFFPNRTKLRSFCSKSKKQGIQRKPVDNGSTAKNGRRWAIDISK